MKTALSKSFLAAILTTGAILLAACATNGPQPQTVSLLGAAGFRVRKPETPKQKEIFATLPAYKVEGVVVNHRTYYVYKDEGKGLALVGGEAEYQRYREMARQERLAAGQHTAMMASAAETEGWYGASGSDWWH